MTDERALTQLVREQRWFGAKSREVAEGRIADSGTLAPDCRLALFEVAFTAGDRALYQLPHRVGQGGEVVLSLADPVLAHALLAAFRSAATIATEHGRATFELTAPLPADADLEPVRPVGGEQSNSSIVFGAHAVLKAYRRLEDGESAELELLRFLDAHGFEHAPRLLGWYAFEGHSIAATLGVLQHYVPDARDGWEFALESLAEPAPFIPRLERLGEVTARMHTVLASDAHDPAFCPEPLGDAPEADARALLQGLAPLEQRYDEIVERLRLQHRLGTGGQAIRQHGDYHLGQVLWAHDDWLVIDFEGEPARPLSERRRKSTPLRDVAGMLRSLAYVAETCRGRGVALPPNWESDARAAFLGGYESAIDETLLPPRGKARDSLLAASELEKALYELRYELDNRPTWAHVPLAGIERLLTEAGRTGSDP